MTPENETTFLEIIKGFSKGQKILLIFFAFIIAIFITTTTMFFIKIIEEKAIAEKNQVFLEKCIVNKEHQKTSLEEKKCK